MAPNKQKLAAFIALKWGESALTAVDSPFGLNWQHLAAERALAGDAVEL